MSDRTVRVSRSWPPHDAMAASAREQGWSVEYVDHGATLVVEGRSRALPDVTTCDQLRISLALGAIADSLRPAPTVAVATVLDPAAGVCGPASAGPVDSIRDDGHRSGYTIGARPVSWSARTLAVQQSRCWLVSATFDGPWSGGDDRPRCALPVLPPVVSRDTARATQYQLDRGRGVHWPEVLLLGQPVARDGRVRVLAIHTDGLLTTYLLDQATPLLDQATSPLDQTTSGTGPTSAGTPEVVG